MFVVTEKEIDMKSSACMKSGFVSSQRGAQRAKIAEKVHKPSLGVNVINFKLNGFNAFIWVSWSPSDPKKL